MELAIIGSDIQVQCISHKHDIHLISDYCTSVNSPQLITNVILLYYAGGDWVGSCYQHSLQWDVSG